MTNVHRFIFGFVTLLVAPGFGAQAVSSAVRKCGSQFAKEVESRGSRDAWIEQAPTEDGGKSFRTPTKKFGTWLEVNIDGIGRPTLFEVSELVTHKVTFGPDCKATARETQGLSLQSRYPDKMATWYNDEQFKKDIEKFKEGIVYVWSPEMVYSAKYYKYFRDTAKKLNLKFIPLIDPRTKLSLVTKAEKDYGINPSNVKLNSVEVFERNATTHYPTSLVFANGKIHESLIVGVMEPEQFQATVQKRLQELKAER